MPEMDGVELMHKVREDADNINSDTPIIAVTANAVSGAREMYISEGFTDYLAKPVNMATLGRILDKYLSIGGNEKAEVNDPEEFPDIDGVDWNYALYKLHDAALLRSVVSDYIMTADEDAAEINKFYENLMANSDEDAFHDYEVKVHSMKSSAAMFGATGISNLAKLLEYAAKDYDIDRIKILMPVFMDEREKNLNLLREAFNNENEDNDNEAKELIDVNLFRQYLDMLENAMSELDTDTADSIMEELKGYAYSEIISNFIKNLEVQVRNLDEDKVSEIVQKIKDNNGEVGELRILNIKEPNYRKIYNNMRLDECPVCGYMVETYKNDEGYYIKCPECGYKSDYYNTAIDATNDWNKGDQNVELDTDE